MKLKIEKLKASHPHQELVSAVGWNAFNELYSCSDDQTVCRWDMNGDAGGKVRVSRHLTSASHALAGHFCLCVRGSN
jgi:intraflagellar transport protein 80